MTAYLGGVPHRYRAVNLSCTGALVQRSDNRPPPMVHVLELHLAGGKPLRGVARTVWTDEHTHGVRFVELSDVDRLDIAEHVDAQNRRHRRAF